MGLFDFAYCGNYNSKLVGLSILSPEKWSFNEANDNRILKKYLEHTYRRLEEENKIYTDEEKAVFNTGLFDIYFQPIYAYFVKNRVEDQQKWYLENFINEYQLSSFGINPLPERANYFNDNSDLIFDTRLDIIPQYDHIFGDLENIERMPAIVRTSSMRVQLFDGAIKIATRMLEANYKVAVPQYYNRRIQLLVPLCLQNAGIPDLALACVKNEDETKYLGRTCLTLEMAYNNARLIAKPESNWLRP
ncbi:MAG: DUF3825 domain-containing protein [Lachnospiraceae bacterium]|nr:DUF3825 domain-containing protein [Lachnospiraceae bacterium]